MSQQLAYLAVAGMGLAVVQLLFEYLGMLRARGPQQWLYTELAEIGAMKARFLEEEDAMDYVTGLASNLLLVQPQHALLSDYLYEDWQPELVSSPQPFPVSCHQAHLLSGQRLATTSSSCRARRCR